MKKKKNNNNNNKKKKKKNEAFRCLDFLEKKKKKINSYLVFIIVLFTHQIWRLQVSIVFQETYIPLSAYNHGLTSLDDTTPYVNKQLDKTKSSG